MKPGNEQEHAERRARLAADPAYEQALEERREQVAAARRDGTPEPPQIKRHRTTGAIVHSEQTATEVRMVAAERAARAAEMKVQRYSWETIAKTLGYKSAAVARKSVDRYIERLPRDSVEELRAQELQSLDLAERALADRIRQGDTQAIDSMLKIKHHRARLMRLYADAPGVTNIDIDLLVVQTATETARLLKTHPDMNVDQLVAGLLRLE